MFRSKKKEKIIRLKIRIADEYGVSAMFARIHQSQRYLFIRCHWNLSVSLASVGDLVKTNERLSLANRMIHHKKLRRRGETPLKWTKISINFYFQFVDSWLAADIGAVIIFSGAFFKEKCPSKILTQIIQNQKN